MKIELSSGKKYIHLGTGEKGRMRGNIRFDLTHGARGTKMLFELYGKTQEYQPVNPTVWLTVKQRHSAPVIDFAWCEGITTAVSGEDFSIKGFFVFDGERAELAAGEYQMRFTAFEAENETRRTFPTDAAQPHGILTVIEKF